MRDRPQSYATHRRVNPVQQGVVMPILLVNLVALTVAAAQAPSWPTILGAVTAFALLLFAIGTRSMCVTLQDRIIRVEQGLRLERLLPDPLRARIDELTLPHLIALRFASDRELPGLVERTLSGELATADAIKRAVSDWRADRLRV